MNFFKKSFKNLVILALFIAPFPLNALNANEDLSEHPVFLARETGSNKVVDNIEYGHNVMIQTVDGSKHLSPDGALFLIANAKKMDKLSSVGMIRNLGDQNQEVNVVFTTPKYEAGLMGVDIEISDAPTYSNDLALIGSNLKSTYSAVGGEYLTEDDYLAKYTWSDLIAVQITGKLNANEKLEVTMAYAYEQLTTEILHEPTRTIMFRTLGFMPSASDSAYTMLRFANPTALPLNDPVAVKRNLDGSYTVLNETVQAYLPKLDISSFNIHNFHELDKFDDKNYLFTGGVYSLNLDFINEALKDEGYSVGAFDEESFRSQYFYYAGLGKPPVFEDEDGNPSEIANDSLYLEVHQVIDAIDSELNVGDDWSFKDNLIKVSSPFDGSDLADRIIVEGDVDLNTAGTYPIKFSLNFDNVLISKSINVTVNEVIINTAQVTTHYKTKDGLEIKSPTTQVLPVGTNYTTEVLDSIDYNNETYKLISIPENASGIVLDVDQLVTYIYAVQKNEKPITPVDKPNTDNKKQPETSVSSNESFYLTMSLSALGLLVSLKARGKYNFN